MTKYVLSYGGGIDSTALMILLKERGDPLDLVLFADTGAEKKPTYDSIEFYKKLSPVEFVTVSSPLGEIYSYYYGKGITPSRKFRDCTDKFKIQPMRRYLRSRFGKQENFIFYVAIDYGEAHRVSDSDVKYVVKKHPLVDAKMKREDCVKFLQERNLPIPPKSACWFCPFTSRKEWIEMSENNPEAFARAVALEQNNQSYPESKSLLRDVPLVEIIRLYKAEKEKNKGQLTFEVFDKIDPEPVPSCNTLGSCFS